MKKFILLLVILFALSGCSQSGESYPAVVPFEQGMTLMPGQTAHLVLDIEADTTASSFLTFSDEEGLEEIMRVEAAGSIVFYSEGEEILELRGDGFVYFRGKPMAYDKRVSQIVESMAQANWGE